MDFNPCLNQSGFIGRYLTRKQRAIQDSKRGVLPLVLCVNVWKLMSFVIKEIQVNDQTVEHADCWHRGLESIVDRLLSPTIQQ